MYGINVYGVERERIENTIINTTSAMTTQGAIQMHTMTPRPMDERKQRPNPNSRQRSQNLFLLFC